ncbi:zinc finger protein 367 [Trichonephila clavipes]|nr:zinc finger protein 367 [Trichonephila clavipes]
MAQEEFVNSNTTCVWFKTITMLLKQVFLTDLCFKASEDDLYLYIRVRKDTRDEICDYPECGNAFKQSGQLRTHFRLHTKEDPYKCPVDSCSNRFKHSNRHCTTHKVKGIRMDESFEELQLKFSENRENLSLEKRKWINLKNPYHKVGLSLFPIEENLPERSDAEAAEVLEGFQRTLAEEYKHQSSGPSPKERFYKVLRSNNISEKC